MVIDNNDFCLNSPNCIFAILTDLITESIHWHNVSILFLHGIITEIKLYLTPSYSLIPLRQSTMAFRCSSDMHTYPGKMILFKGESKLALLYISAHSDEFGHQIPIDVGRLRAKQNWYGNYKLSGRHGYDRPQASSESPDNWRHDDKPNTNISPEKPHSGEFYINLPGHPLYGHRVKLTHYEPAATARYCLIENTIFPDFHYQIKATWLSTTPPLPISPSEFRQSSIWIALPALDRMVKIS